MSKAYWKSNLPLLVERLKFVTRRTDWTQEAIATEAGIRQPTISEWMQPGTQFKRLDANVVQKLLGFLNRYFVCSADDLVTFVGDKYKTQEMPQVDDEGQWLGELVKVH